MRKVDNPECKVISLIVDVDLQKKQPKALCVGTLENNTDAANQMKLNLISIEKLD